MRDEFSAGVKDLLAKRAAHMCSNPGCRRPTSGPQAGSSGTVNIGVAAHICAAAPGGPRFDASMSQDQRRAIDNGIWLCQVCAKLVDADEVAYTATRLRQWRDRAERSARHDLEHRWSPVTERTAVYRRIEQRMPALLAEMRRDIASNPLWREFVVLKRAWIYNSRGPYLAYYYDEHEHLDSKLDILQNLGLIRNATWNNTKRYKFSEEFIQYLEATGPASTGSTS